MLIFVMHVSFSLHPTHFQQRNRPRGIYFRRYVIVQLFIRVHVMSRTNSFILFCMYVLLMVRNLTNIGPLVQWLLMVFVSYRDL